MANGIAPRPASMSRKRAAEKEEEDPGNETGDDEGLEAEAKQLKVKPSSNTDFLL
jgi:hypothetical protein